MRKTALLFKYSWLDLIRCLPDTREQMKVINALFEHDKKTPEECTPEEYEKEYNAFENEQSRLIYDYLVKEVDESYNHFLDKGRW